jgi:hypothetical protein
MGESTIRHGVAIYNYIGKDFFQKKKKLHMKDFYLEKTK